MKTLKLNLNKTNKYLVAVSYGPDSMALLSMMQQEGYTFEVAHVNYKKRKESDQEAKDLHSYCAKHSIPLHTKEVSQPLKGNFQDAARRFRYEFFKETLIKQNLDVLVTAHHLDDHMETALFQLVRNSTHLYYGIQPSTVIHGVNTVRPLLPYRKIDLEEYCMTNHVPFAVDSSNALSMYTRNKNRKILQNLSPLEWSNLNHLIQSKNELNFQIEVKIAPLLCKRKLMISTYLSLDYLERFIYWAKLFQKNQLHYKVSKQFLNRIDVFVRSIKPNLSIKLNSTHLLYKSYDHFIVVEAKELEPYVFEVKSASVIQLPLLKFNFQHLPKITPPFIVRSALDKEIIPYMDSNKKITRLFIDWKVPLYLRKIWPVFTNEKHEVIFVPRYRELKLIHNDHWLEIVE
jgi:tRNA(Ile)-lysidine synthetase-like protein